MSKYTHINIFSPHSDEVEDQLTFRQPTRRRKNRIFVRLGGWPDEVKKKLTNENGSLVYDVPIHSNKDLNEGELVARVLIDRFEDTGSSHDTELYKIWAFKGVEKIDEQKIHDDLDGSKTVEYYSENHDLSVRVTY